VKDRRAIVPSEGLKCGRDALEGMLGRQPTKLRAAVAFVSRSGVEILDEVLQGWSGHLELVARGAPITDPHALELLSDRGATVRAVVGRRALKFHPKLWLAESPNGLDVLSGSGNLTDGGLVGNEEQFELLNLGTGDDELAREHRRRFETFFAQGMPFEQLKEDRYWTRWVETSAKREAMEAALLKLERELADSAGTPAENGELYADLLAIYQAAKNEVTIIYDDGSERPYVASRFKQAIDRGRAEGTLVPVVSRIVNGPTEGFGRLAEAGRRDLMVETLVVDETKSYHRFFTVKTQTLAQRISISTSRSTRASKANHLRPGPELRLERRRVLGVASGIAAAM
jgi:HKD family nuclease